jgi:hypothetical protein
VAVLAATATAKAQQSPPAGQEEELIPLPTQNPPELAGEVRLSGVFPVADSPLCPSGSACIFDGGGGVGGRIERRWPSGYTLGLNYDAWFLDANGVYEITVVQMIGAGVRYLMLRDSMTHPFVGINVGALALGDSFKVAAVGGAAEARAGVEIELTETLALTVASAWRVFFTTEFSTNNGAQPRGEDGGPNVAATLQVGLAIMEGPS